LSLIKIFDLRFSSDYHSCLNLLFQLNYIELNAHPDYIKLYAKAGHKPMCAYYESDQGAVMFPFLLRSLTEESWAKNVNCSDITAPYGYSGPFVYNNPDPDIFWDHFDSWARANNVVSLFTRLPLFEEQIIPFRGETIQAANHIVRALHLSLEDLWMDYEHKVRKNVKRARKNDLEIIFDPKGDYLDVFLSIYRQTLNRRNASSFYYFDKEYFLRLLNKLSDYCIFIHVAKDKVIISTELLLLSNNRIYSFLGGTVDQGFRLRANDFLKHSVILWGIENNYSDYILGGGSTPDDGIYKYKKSFAPKGAMPSKIGTRIYDNEQYSKLVEMRSDWEKENSNAWLSNKQYFPAYRS
jgi:hypothetical protein